MAVMMYRYAKYLGLELTAEGSFDAFADANGVSEFAKDAMNWAVGEGIISGMDDVTLAPAETATRAQICAIVMRYLNN